MIFDAVKRFLGIKDGEPLSSRQEYEPRSTTDARGEELVPFRQQSPPDIRQIESDIAQVHKFMEQQMRSMMGSFGFTFGSPFPGFGDDSQLGSFFQFPPGINDIPPPDAFEDPKTPHRELDPRDEVLKPQFRSRSSGQWDGQDKILDERLNKEGFGSVMNELETSEAYGRSNSAFDSFLSFFGNGLINNGPFSPVLGPDSGSGSVSSSVTIYSNVNGRSSVEQIIRHPDGRIERIVKSDDGNSPQQF